MDFLLNVNTFIREAGVNEVEEKQEGKWRKVIKVLTSGEGRMKKEKKWKISSGNDILGKKRRK